MSAQRPLVTVVTTTYNWPSVLRIAIESVLAQTFRDFEYLIVGDCCTDETAALVATFADPRIRWHNLACNSGNQSVPNRVAVEMARGKYVAYLNHDDIWFPHHLELLVKGIERQDVDLLHSLSLDIAPPGHSYRAVLGLPFADPQGEQQGGLVQVITSSIMHPVESALAIGNWREWQSLHEPPTVDFIRRLMDHRRKYAYAKVVTVLKFNSADRANSYRLRLADEQAYYWNLVRHDREFLARELLSVIACQLVGTRPPKLDQDQPPPIVPPGWQIEQWRRMRGLEPMLPGSSDKPEAQGASIG